MGPGGPILNPAPKSVPSATSIVLIMALSIVGIAYCSRETSSRHPTPSPAPAPPIEVAPAAIVEPIDKGNGVYYFPATGDAYMDALVKFYENGNGDRHCDLQGFTEHTHVQERLLVTETTGFILHCHDIAVDAQKVTME